MVPVKVRFGGHTCEIRNQESVLDALLREGVAVSYACKAGACGSCLMRALEGPVPSRAQIGLKESLKARGYLLACMCQPTADLSLELPGAEARLTAGIVSLAWLSADVLRVRLACDAPFNYRAGQYVTLRRSDGLARSYSIASLPTEHELELHVRRIATGRMSGWLATEAAPGGRVELFGPSGDCFYVAGRDEQPLLLVGTGTGLAPLYGIVRDALSSGHRGPIHLFHGAVRPAGLYLQADLARLASKSRNFVYTPTVIEEAQPGMVAGQIDQVVLSQYPKLNGWRGFVCGDTTLVQMLKKKLFLAGMAFGEIHGDAFLPSVA